MPLALSYFFPVDLVTLLPFLNFGNTIDALRLLRFFSILPFPDLGLEEVLAANWSTSMSNILSLA